MIGIKHIEYYLPEKTLSNEDLSYLGIDPVFMSTKIGIEKRYIAAENESVCDMAVKACLKLFNQKNVNPIDIPLLILVTQNPDYVLPTTACILQNEIGLNKSTMCFDINLGCSGYVYACAVAIALMNQFHFENSLVVTSEAYSKVISYEDKTVASLFSDAASATLLTNDCESSFFIDFNFGTDGKGCNNLIVPVSGSRERRTSKTSEQIFCSPGIKRSRENLYMNGQEITKFVFSEIPKSINELIAKNNFSNNNIDRYFFHQANKYMLESLGKRMSLEIEKVYIDLSIGNTVSSTIPIALKSYYGENKKSNTKELLILSGFGVGYSWANTLLNINNNFGENL